MTQDVRWGKRNRRERQRAALALCAIVPLLFASAGLASAGQTFTTRFTFDGADGWYPSTLVQATDGNLYGCASVEGNGRGGTIFRMDPSGKLTTIYSSCVSGPSCVGSYACSGLIQAADGNFYGTTEAGGDFDCGTIFKITPSGTSTTIYSFAGATTPEGTICPDGQVPSPLIQASDGNFYGTTLYGGHSDLTEFDARRGAEEGLRLDASAMLTLKKFRPCFQPTRLIAGTIFPG
jgi:uncharacterized repeat protein (TIGR03803 family)